MCKLKIRAAGRPAAAGHASLTIQNIYCDQFVRSGHELWTHDRWRDATNVWVQEFKLDEFLVQLVVQSLSDNSDIRVTFVL